jgi:hypothetical protein
MKIDFKKFIEYTNSIKDSDDEIFIISQMMRVFFPRRKDYDNCIAKFNHSINNVEPEKLPFWYKIDIGLKRAGKFIDADTFLNEEMLIEFIDTVVKHRIPFCKPKVTINQARWVIDFFVNARGK